MSKPFVINPWMLDQADRLVDYAVIQGLPLPSSQSWGFLEGFRRASQDIDRTPGRWLQGWHPLSRASLEKAHSVRPSRQGLPRAGMHDISENPGVAFFDFDRDPSGRLGKRLASQLIDARASQQQAWIRLPAGVTVATPALDGALRLGAAWWCEPGLDRPAWEAYTNDQVKWAETILKSAEWDQWVWPWCNMIEQGLRICCHGRKPAPSRFGFPEGWKDRRAAAWGTLGMKTWSSAVELVPEWEDLWIGLLFHRLGLGSALADKS